MLASGKAEFDPSAFPRGFEPEDIVESLAGDPPLFSGREMGFEQIYKNVQVRRGFVSRKALRRLLLLMVSAGRLQSRRCLSASVSGGKPLTVFSLPTGGSDD